MKISEFIIGMIVIGFFTFSIGYVLTEVSSNYGVTYDNSTIVKYEQYRGELTNLTKDLQSETNSTKTSSAIDILGDLFQSGYNTIKLTYQSYDTFSDMSSDAIEDADIPEANYLKYVIGTIVLLTIIFVIVGILLKTPDL